MFLDASAVVAILERETDWREQQARLEAGAPLWYSPIVRFEVAQAIARARSGARNPRPRNWPKQSGHVDRFFHAIETLRWSQLMTTIGALAIEASIRYGKAVGHPAGLNMGDCFAYACAKSLNVPLLYKGGDFAQTDLAQTDLA